MEPTAINCLAMFGATCAIVFGFFIVYGLVCGLKELITHLKWQYKYKHRFDKPPTAACYCKDCKRHNNENQECYKFKGWRTADNWFCWDAYPLERDPDVPKQSN